MLLSSDSVCRNTDHSWRQVPEEFFADVRRVAAVPSKYSIWPNFDPISASFAHWAVESHAHRIPSQGVFEIAGASDSLGQSAAN